ncbi:antibiotic biosynthesis monooxygenase [Halomonas sp. MC140]|nr:antibiotic biosynthesis monooxygenase [Halomonas sp. MC140]MDN7131224.1 antibiotic biosynthesis monooxygenase [Halomonas sp. MC140]
MAILSDFVVIAEFEVADAHLEVFLAAAEQDAIRSLADEPGCLQFDINVNETSLISNVLFYEVYRSQEAFDSHLLTSHLAAFRDSLALVERELPVRFLTRRHS